MPDSRFSPETLLKAARVALPAFPMVALWIGLAYVFGSPARYVSPSLDVAKDIMPIQTWGALFLLVATIELAAWLLGGNRMWFSFALFVGALMFTVWAIVLAIAIFTVPDASLVGPVFPLFVVLIQASFIVYLNHDWHQIVAPRRVGDGPTAK